MNKRFATIAVAMLAMLGSAACGSDSIDKSSKEGTALPKAKIEVLTDWASIDDRSVRYVRIDAHCFLETHRYDAGLTLVPCPDDKSNELG